MGSASRASWVVLASVGAVEALKDQVGLCRWNYALRSLYQHGKNSLGSFSQASLKSSASSQARSNQIRQLSSAFGDQMAKGSVAEERVRRREAEKAERVMHLICWGPK